MKGDKIKYKEGYKYQLVEDYSIQIDLKNYSVINDFFILTKDGLLTVKNGYAWDGASGPTIDTPSSMRGSLIHDVFYQMFREKLLPLTLRDFADDLLMDICIEDGMYPWRAKIWYKAVSSCAQSAATEETKIYTAP